MRKCVDQAMQGDRTAMKICMDRVSQTGSKSPIRMKLPPVKTLQDVDQAAERVMQDVARGKLTPADGEKMMRMLESRARVIEKAVLEKHVEKLEEAIAETN